MTGTTLVVVPKREKVERQLNLVICLLSTRQFVSAEYIRANVGGYYENDSSDDAFYRMFERDKAELRELVDLAEAERQRQQWTNDTELLAGILEQLRSLTAVVQSGIPTVQVRKLRGAKQPKPIDRPSWLAKASDGVATVRPSEFFHMMKA